MHLKSAQFPPWPKKRARSTLERAKVLAANDHFVSDSMIDPNDGDAHSFSQISV